MMANWAKLQEDLTGLRVVKRAQHGIHFDKGNGQILANFSGKPCHFLDGKIWKPIDTKLLLLPDGFYGCPHSPVRVHKDGHVKVDGTDYQQYTELPSATGLVDNDCIVREFSFGKQEMRITENGYRSEITLNRIPTLKEARKLIASESGTLSKEYLKSLTTATDANNDVHTVSTLSAFRTWLAGAKFPVVIDPDFAGSTVDGYIRGDGTTASTVNTSEDNANYFGYYGGWNRNYYLFDTSSIDDDATITQNNLKLTKYFSSFTGANWTGLIVKQTWAAPLGTNMESNYDGARSADLDDGNMGASNTWANNTQRTSGNLSTTWVNKTGNTTYSLISSKDRAAEEPPAGNDAIAIYHSEYTTESYRPVLTVTYTAGGTFIPINMNAQMQNLSGNMRG